MRFECKVMFVKYALTKNGQIRQNRFEIKNKLMT